MNNNLFNYLVANDKMNEFLTLSVTYIEVENYLKNLSLTKQISLDLLQKSFKEQIK